MKISIISPFIYDANSFWRATGPWTYLKKHSETPIELHIPTQDVGWSDFADSDLIFFHRPSRDVDLQIQRLAWHLKIPTWVDYDDWLFDLPPWNPNKTYRKESVQETVAKMILGSDLVSVSTQLLKEAFSEIHPSVVVLSNAYRDDLFGYVTPWKDMERERKVIAWRGTKTHEGDLIDSLPWILENQKRFRFHFFGDPGKMITKYLDPTQVIFHGKLPLFEYFKRLHDVRPDYVLNPLRDCFFNRCKSNIAWLEAIHANALCISQDWDEWQHGGNIHEFVQEENNAFQKIMFARHAIRKLFSIQVVNEQRVYDLNSLVSKEIDFGQSKFETHNDDTAKEAVKKLKDFQRKMEENQYQI